MGRNHIPRVRSQGQYTTLESIQDVFTDPKISPKPYQWRYTCSKAPKKAELMWDVTGFQECEFNPCWHEKVLCPDLSGLMYQSPAPGSEAPNPTIRWEQGIFADPVAVSRSIPLDLEDWIADFGANAYLHFVENVSQDGSIINFLIETAELLEFNLKGLKEVGDKILKSLKAFRSAFKRTGKFWLAWNFAIRPTMRDLWNLFHTIERAQKRLNWLREHNHKITKVKYREGPRNLSGNFVGPFPDVLYGERVYPPPGGLEFGLPDPKSTVELHCAYDARVVLSSWALVRIDIDDSFLDGLCGLGIVAMTIQGLYNPLGIVWEAIPFSWLIDWFRSQKSKVDQLLAGDLTPLGHATILQSGWSISLKTFGEMEWVHQPGEFLRLPAGSFLATLYVRQPDLPDGGSPFRVPFRWYNLSIIAALLAQRRRH